MGIIDDDIRESSVEGERRVGGDESDGGRTDKNAGGYIGVFATLGVEKRWDASAFN